MNDDREMAQVKATVDKEYYEQAKRELEHGELSEIMRDLIDCIARGGHDDRTPYDVVLKHKRQKRKEAVRARDRATQRIEDLDHEIELLERERSNYKSDKEKIHGAIDMFETEFRLGEHGHIAVEHPKITRIAEQYDREPKQIHELFQSRNPDVPAAAFKDMMKLNRDQTRFTGLENDVANLPVEKRENTRAE